MCQFSNANPCEMREKEKEKYRKKEKGYALRVSARRVRPQMGTSQFASDDDLLI